MLVDLSEKINNLSEDDIFLMSFFIVFNNLLLYFLNLMFFINLYKAFPKSANLATGRFLICVVLYEKGVSSKILPQNQATFHVYPLLCISLLLSTFLLKLIFILCEKEKYIPKDI